MVSITRLSGGLTPADGSDPRTFPTIFNGAADAIEANGTAITGLDSRLTTAEGDIVSNGTAIAAQGSAIAVLEGLNPVAFGTATASNGQILAYGTATASWNPTDGGKLVAVKHALFTGTQTNVTGAGANFAVTDLSITHAMADASNKLIISAYFGIAASSTGFGNVGIAVADDGTLIGIGDAEGPRTRVGAGGRVVQTDTGDRVVTMPSVMFVYEPGDTASHTYTVRAIQADTSTHTIYINRTANDGAGTSIQRASSGFVIQEVKA